MPLRRPLLALLSATLPLAVAGCGDDDLTPADVYGVWALETPPGVTATAAQTADTLVFLDERPIDGARNAGYERVGHLVPRAGAAPGSAPDSLVTESVAFRFAVRGPSEVRITFVCPLNASCAPGPHLVGPLDGDVLTLNYGFAVDGPTRRFRRVASIAVFGPR